MTNERYSRQIILKTIGTEGQAKLSKSSVVIIGCGALGGVIANNLTRAGIGKIRIVDRDLVELNNLQRQSLFDENDIGRPKSTAASEKLKIINSKIIIEPILDDVNFHNIELIIRGFDLIVDGTDNMETRMLINDACIKNKIPWVYGGAIEHYGMSMNILPGGPCLRCVLPNLPEPGLMGTCDTSGILNTIPPIIGSIESTEALKILLGQPANKSLLFYDIWNHEYRSVDVKKNETCECCVKNNFEFLNSGETEIITSLCGTNTIQIIKLNEVELSLANLSEKLQNAGEVELNDDILKFKTTDYEIDIFKNGRVLIQGTEDKNVAKSIYAKYIGQ